jgi:hypothetical protein
MRWGPAWTIPTPQVPTRAPIRPAIQVPNHPAIRPATRVLTRAPIQAPHLVVIQVLSRAPILAQNRAVIQVLTRAPIQALTQAPNLAIFQLLTRAQIRPRTLSAVEQLVSLVSGMPLVLTVVARQELVPEADLIFVLNWTTCSRVSSTVPQASSVHLRNNPNKPHQEPSLMFVDSTY